MILVLTSEEEEDGVVENEDGGPCAYTDHKRLEFRDSDMEETV